MKGHQPGTAEGLEVPVPSTSLRAHHLQPSEGDGIVGRTALRGRVQTRPLLPAARFLQEQARNLAQAQQWPRHLLPSAGSFQEQTAAHKTIAPPHGFGPGCHKVDGS